jgi:branched-chain amino acid transport system ATP-binding protein
MTILTMSGVNTFYGRSHILFDIDLQVEEGCTTGLLGRNGAGKTTTLKTIMGLVPPRLGTIMFRQQEIAGLQAHQVSIRGIAYVPDDRQIFAPLTVFENLIIGVPKGRNKTRKKRWDIERIYELFPVLSRMADKGGTHISGGEQKMLAIGRALMMDPDLLLLDEPTEGLAPIIVSSLMSTIKKIQSEGVTILMADQNVNFTRTIIDYGYIIDKGCIEHYGAMGDIWDDKDLLCKYLAV